MSWVLLGATVAVILGFGLAHNRAARDRAARAADLAAAFARLERREAIALLAVAGLCGLAGLWWQALLNGVVAVWFAHQARRMQARATVERFRGR